METPSNDLESLPSKLRLVSETLYPESTLRWSSLPVEIQEMILGFFNGNSPARSLNRVNFQPASVCRQWRNLLEPLNFKSLSLGSDDVPAFEKIIRRDAPDYRRLGYIRQLRLTISLPAYDSDREKEQECYETTLRNQAAFAAGVTRLIRVLALSPETSSPGLALELCASSPSDGEAFDVTQLWKSFFNEFIEATEHPDEIPYENYRDALMARRSLDELPEFTFQSTAVFDSLHVPLMHLDVHQLVPAPIIREFSVPRQSMRLVYEPALSSLIRTCMPQLKCLRIERWSFDVPNHDHHQLWSGIFLPGLRELHLFNDNYWFFPSTPPEHNAAQLSQQLPDLEHLSLTGFYSHQASWFFTEPRSHTSASRQGTWPALRTLAVSDRCLLDRDEDMMLDMLTKAANAMARMPKLEVMELWFAKGSQSYTWSFNRVKNRIRILWHDGKTDTRGNILRNLAEEWRRMLKDVVRIDQDIEIELGLFDIPLDRWKCSRRSDVVASLELSRHVVSPRTLVQLKLEDDIPNKIVYNILENTI